MRPTHAIRLVIQALITLPFMVGCISTQREMSSGHNAIGIYVLPNMPTGVADNAAGIDTESDAFLNALQVAQQTGLPVIYANITTGDVEGRADSVLDNVANPSGTVTADAEVNADARVSADGASVAAAPASASGDGGTVIKQPEPEPEPDPTPVESEPEPVPAQPETTDAEPITPTPED